MQLDIKIGDAIEQLKTIPDKTFRCCVTSPPYWGLRDYQVEGQLGMESTPEAFIENMLKVFDEVKRVLTDDGTLWLNIGDSYAGASGGFQGKTGQRASRTFTARIAQNKVVGNLKPKDMVGIPWALAKALRDPRYTGDIKDERDRIWMAAMLDAEGCMFIHKRKAGQSNGLGYLRKSDTYSPGIEISNTSLALVEKIMAIVGKGSICSQSPDQNVRRMQTIYRWNLRSSESKKLAQELYPYLVAKQHQARILCGCPSSGKIAEDAHAALIGLHNGIDTIIDFPEPESLFTQGWYLRSDIIWFKTNPMPESQKDRPTKSYEHVFLLSKSRYYYYDSDAIREPRVQEEDANGFRGGAYTHDESQDDNGMGGKRKSRGNRVVRPAGWSTHGDGTAMDWNIKGNRRRAREAGTDTAATEAKAVHTAAEAQAANGAGKALNTGTGVGWHRSSENAASPQKDKPERVKTIIVSGTKNRRDVWPLATQASILPHFATFPELLVKPCILAGSAPGDRVLDPFGGTGTTALVALNFGRSATIVELNPEYAAMAEQRCSGFTPGLAL